MSLWFLRLGLDSHATAGWTGLPWLHRKAEDEMLKMRYLRWDWWLWAHLQGVTAEICGFGTPGIPLTLFKLLKVISEQIFNDGSSKKNTHFQYHDLLWFSFYRAEGSQEGAPRTLQWESEMHWDSEAQFKTRSCITRKNNMPKKPKVSC